MLNPMRFLRRVIYLQAFGEEGGGGGSSVIDAPAPVAAPPAPAESAPAPQSMHEAMWNRDDAGRFAPKAADVAAQGLTGAPAAPAAPQPGAPAAQAAPKPAEPAADDLTALPDGLGPKAQERFQRLANGIKERDGQIEQLGGMVNYVQETFQANGVQREQFEQAVGVIGMLNKGDFRGALQVLDDQRRQIALQLGEALPGVDALSGFPDLRQKVDALHMTEADALETAKLRQHQSAYQQRQQADQQSQQQAQAHQAAVGGAQQAVDAFCKRAAATDLDFAAIEALLLPRIPRLLANVPPQQWAQAVQTQYEIIKESGAAFRRAPAAGQSPAALRPTGQGSANPVPQTMFEAMWKRPQA